MPVSIRVPEEIARRIAKIADARGITAQAFMLEAIREKVDAEEAQAASVARASGILSRNTESGLTNEARISAI